MSFGAIVSGIVAQVQDFFDRQRTRLWVVAHATDFLGVSLLGGHIGR